MSLSLPKIKKKKLIIDQDDEDNDDINYEDDDNNGGNLIGCGCSQKGRLTTLWSHLFSSSTLCAFKCVLKLPARNKMMMTIDDQGNSGNLIGCGCSQ